MIETPSSCPKRSPRDLAAIAVALVLPTLGTLLYWVAFSGHPAMLPLSGATKIIQFSLPLVWVLWVQKERIRWKEAPRRGFGAGLFWGLAIFNVVVIGYYLVYRSSPALAEAPAAVGDKLDDLGLNTPWRFIALAVFISVPHSFLEEYYWRWFAFGQLRRWTNFPVAVVISSLGFMSHHILVINAYIPEQYFWSATMVFSGSVAVGGVLWAWLYERTGSIYGAWVSHLLADVAIMVVGWDLVFGG